jgi:hypothetical protein
MQRDRNAWPLAIGAASLYCVNQWLGARGTTWPTSLLVLLLLGSVAATVLSPTLRRHLPAIFLLSVIGFPEYSADPYAQGYISPFGLAKFASLAALALMCRLGLSAPGVAFALIVAGATGAAAVAGRLGDVWAEVWYLLLILLALNARAVPGVEVAARSMLESLERIFYLLLPLALFTRVTGLIDERAGDSIVYFYGHWVGIVTAFAIYAATARRSSVFRSSPMRIALLVATIAVCMPSYQSAHFILFILALLIAYFEGREDKQAGSMSQRWLPAVALVVLLGVGGLVLVQGQSDTWLYLKISQIFLLFSGGFLEASNSVTIRISQLVTMFEQGSLLTILFGRGAFSTYQADGAFWDIVVFHIATFPEREILAGELQYIHEPVVMLLKWGGVFGLGIACFGLLRLRRSALVDRPLANLIAVTYLLFFASSLQTGMLLTAVFVLFMDRPRHG